MMSFVLLPIKHTTAKEGDTVNCDGGDALAAIPVGVLMGDDVRISIPNEDEASESGAKSL